MDIPLSRVWAGFESRRLAVAACVAIVLSSFGLALLINGMLDLRPGPNEYSLPAWEARNFLNKWLYEAGHPFGDGRSLAQEDRDLLAFFDSIDAVDALERQQAGSAPPQLVDAIKTRDRLENRAEATIEHRIAAVAADEGIERGLGPLGHILWPPVDLEFTTSPMTLAESPRDRITLTRTTLLRAGLDLPGVTRIEQRAESQANVSALAFPIAGVGAYPTIVSYDSDYADVVRVAAHEWVHNYLAFRPLGFHYYENNDLRTINESVADLVGKELADAVVDRWPLSRTQADTSARRPPDIDPHAELVKLRGEVEALLAQGRIDDAEALMEERRKYLAANGYYIRKINQAYFAFTNLYAGEAGSPGATNPIGPKLDELRRRAGSLSRFLEVVGNVTSVADLDSALADLS